MEIKVKEITYCYELERSQNASRKFAYLENFKFKCVFLRSQFPNLP